MLIKYKTKNHNKYRRIINEKIAKKLLVQYPDKTQQHSCQDHLKWIKVVSIENLFL